MLMDDVILCPYQQCFSHIRTMGGDNKNNADNAVCSGALFTLEKILPGVGIELGPLDQ